MKNIQVIDLFAGPGGLGEGFSSFQVKGDNPFKIAISIEKDLHAHQTLTLRSFFRQFKKAPFEYYEYLRGNITKEELFNKFPVESNRAKEEACLIELGSSDHPHISVINKIRSSLKNKTETVLIGGPPCQAYSLVGRSKMSKKEGFDRDPRHTLYMEYLKVIQEFKPSVFVMENVKGILSSKLDGNYIFDQILIDLKNPSKTLNPSRTRFKNSEMYSIYSLVVDKQPEELGRKDFTIKSEDYGIPQARHRVILLGVRKDLKTKPSILKKALSHVSVGDVISDLPKLRSGLSKLEDTYENWKKEVSKYDDSFKVYSKLTRGANFLRTKDICAPKKYENWYVDKEIEGVLNHETRGHITADLHRYYYLSLHTKKNGGNLKLNELPKNLLPNHKNVKKAIASKSLFSDRFKVQQENKYATTITSHISRDGNYFIHPDPKQCRSLTVREAARIQTFPDNYIFEGPRTMQYHQVGNAVPPLLAKQIANIVYKLLNSHELL